MESHFAAFVPAGVMPTPHQRKRQTQQQGRVVNTLLTVQNTLLPAGFNRQSGTAAIVSMVITLERIVFLPYIRHHFVVSYCTAVLIYVWKVIRMNAESSLRRPFTISSIFSHQASVCEYPDRSPTRALDQTTARQSDTAMSCKRLPKRQQHPEKLQVNLGT